MEKVKKASGKGTSAGGHVPADAPSPPARNVAAALGRKPPRKIGREMLLLETRRLRVVFNEIAERYIEETEGRIASAIAAIEKKPLPARKIAELIETVQSLTVKSRKGRRKDLARIEKLTETLLKALE